MRNCLRPEEIEALVAEGLVDAIEGRNAKTSLESLNRRAVDYGREHGLAIGAGSDAHVPSALGAAYVEMPDFSDPAGFVDGLLAGRLVGHHYDQPRPWTPRIVPSIEDPISG
jgi:predicted metal-dependent phosphoesterase TrpH